MLEFLYKVSHKFAFAFRVIRPLLVPVNTAYLAVKEDVPVVEEGVASCCCWLKRAGLADFEADESLPIDSRLKLSRSSWFKAFDLIVEGRVGRKKF